jgi:hypothetical protein
VAQASRKPFTSTLSTTEDNRNGTQALLGVSSNSQTAMGEQLTLSGLFPPGMTTSITTDWTTTSSSTAKARN